MRARAGIVALVASHEQQERPLRPSRERRRSLLSRQFISVIEPLLEAGERYADISVERLVNEAGIARATFYTYYVDKGDLLAAIAEDIQTKLVAAGQSWWDFPPDGDKAALRDALRPAIDVHRAHYKIMGALAEAAAYDDGVRERYNGLMEWIVHNLERHIRTAQQHSAAADLEPGSTALWLVWMLERGLYQFVGSADQVRAERFIDALTAIVWRALYQGYRPEH